MNLAGEQSLIFFQIFRSDLLSRGFQGSVLHQAGCEGKQEQVHFSSDLKQARIFYLMAGFSAMVRFSSNKTKKYPPSSKDEPQMIEEGNWKGLETPHINCDQVYIADI